MELGTIWRDKRNNFKVDLIHEKAGNMCTCKTWVQVITRKSTCFTRHFCNCLSWHLLCLRQKSPGCSRPRFICRGPELTMGQIQALTVGSRQVAVMGRQERGRDGWILGAGIRTPASNIAAVISCRSSHIPPSSGVTLNLFSHPSRIINPALNIWLLRNANRSIIKI